MEGAGHGGTEPDALGAQLMFDFLLHGRKIFPVKKAACDARLIRDDDHRHVGCICGGNQCRDARNESNVFGFRKISRIFDNDAVAIEKEGRLRRLGADRG